MLYVFLMPGFGKESKHIMFVVDAAYYNQIRVRNLDILSNAFRFM